MHEANRLFCSALGRETSEDEGSALERSKLLVIVVVDRDFVCIRRFTWKNALHVDTMQSV